MAMVRWWIDPAPAEPKLILPGCCLASAMNSSSVVAGTDGFATNMVGRLTSAVTGATRRHMQCSKLLSIRLSRRRGRSHVNMHVDVRRSCELVHIRHQSSHGIPLLQLPHVAVEHWEILDAQDQCVCHCRRYGRDWLRSMERVDRRTCRRPFARSGH